MWSAAYAKPFIRSRTGYIFTPVSCLVYTSSILTEVPPTGYHCQGCPNSTPHLLLTTPARYLLLYSGVEEAIARVFSERSLVSRCSCRSFTSYYTGGQKKKVITPPSNPRAVVVSFLIHCSLCIAYRSSFRFFSRMYGVRSIQW